MNNIVSKDISNDLLITIALQDAAKYSTLELNAVEEIKKQIEYSTTRLGVLQYKHWLHTQRDKIKLLLSDQIKESDDEICKQVEVVRNELKELEYQLLQHIAGCFNLSGQDSVVEKIKAKLLSLFNDTPLGLEGVAMGIDSLLEHKKWIMWIIGGGMESFYAELHRIVHKTLPETGNVEVDDLTQLLQHLDTGGSSNKDEYIEGLEREVSALEIRVGKALQHNDQLCVAIREGESVTQEQLKLQREMYEERVRDLTAKLESKEACGTEQLVTSLSEKDRLLQGANDRVRGLEGELELERNRALAYRRTIDALEKEMNELTNCKKDFKLLVRGILDHEKNRNRLESVVEELRDAVAIL